MESRRAFIGGVAGVSVGAIGAALASSCDAQQPPRPATSGDLQPAALAQLAGDGRADDGAVLTRAMTEAASAGGGTLRLPPGAYRLTEEVDIPLGVTLAFADGALLTGEGRLRVSGGIQAGLQQIFDGVRAIFAPGRGAWVYPQWWGARGDGRHDDTDALQAAIAARTVVLPAGEYRTTRELRVGNRTTIFGVGNSWSPTGTTDSWIRYDGPDDRRVAVLRVAGAAVGTDPSDAISSVHVEKVVLDGGGKAGHGLYSVYCTNDSTFTDITARRCTEHGFFISQQWYSSYRNLVARNNPGCGITIGALFDGWQDRGVNGILFENLRAARNGEDEQFDERSRLRWGYGVLFRPGAGSSLRQVVAEQNYGPGLIYDLGPRPSTRVDGGYLEGNGVEAQRAGASRAWGLVVIGHANARANRITSLYLRGEIGVAGAQSVWLTGDAPAGDLVLEDLSHGHHLRADWPRYRFQGYVYPGLSEHVTGHGPARQSQEVR